jgi:hypothetical protein
MDFAGIIESWRQVLMQPGEEAFEREKSSPYANLATAIILMVIAGVIAGIFSFLQAQIFGSGLDALTDTGLPPEVTGQLSALVSGGLGLWSIVLTPLFFVIGVALVHIVAKALGGEGDMGVMAYLLAIVSAPITIASAVFGFIPLLGPCVALLLSIYGLVLNYFAIKVNYSLTSGKAIAVLVVNIFVVVVLSACIGAAIAAATIARV